MEAKTASLPPPVGGWDAQNALADMPIENAVILDNWFPGTDKVTMRRGYASHATGMPDSVETLLEYTPADGNGELYAVSDGKIYDVTSAGAVGAAVVSGLSNSRFQQTQITTSGGHFLFAPNGQDTPRTYNGTSWATASITGPTAANLVWCNNHQRRLWFGEIGSLDAWYLAVDSISGSATKFPLGAVARLGGYIMAMGTWTRDGGDGTDDVAVFVTSEGEAIVYAGTDPSSASTWSLIGVFRIGRPIGRRCMIKAGADLIMITEDGFVAASSILSIDRAQTDRVAISRQINKAVNDAVRDYGGNFGWQPIIYPKGTMLIFNVPQTAGTYHQYVFNTITQRPCRFTGINAICWGMREDQIFFGTSDGTVMEFDSGNSDNGTDIAGDALQAFSYFDKSGTQKSFKRVEILFQSSDDPAPAIDLNVDFQIKSPTGVSAGVSSGAALWGISKWGIGLWGSPNQIFRGWRGVRGHGRAGSIRVRVNTKSAQPSWIASRLIYTPGGML